MHGRKNIKANPLSHFIPILSQVLDKCTINRLLVFDLLCRNPHWRSQITFSTNGVYLDSRTLDKILYAVDISDMPLQLLQSVLSPFLQIGTMIDSFDSSDNSSLSQIELISLWISERIVLFPDLFSSVGIWKIPGDL